MHSQTCPSIAKSATEVIPRKRNAKIRGKPELKAGIFCVLESGICSGRIRNSAPGIRNPQRGIQNLFEQTDLRVTGFYEYFDVNIYLHNRKLT